MSASLSDEFLPFHRPSLGEEEIAEVCDTLRSGWLTLGPKTLRFEEKFAQKLGARYAVAVSSCTAALHLALEALGIGPGDEVITTPYTFTATVAAILYTGATPVLADVDPDYPNLDPETIAARVTPRTKAILPVHFGGAPCDLDAIGTVGDGCGGGVVEGVSAKSGFQFWPTAGVLFAPFLFVWFVYVLLAPYHLFKKLALTKGVEYHQVRFMLAGTMRTSKKGSFTQFTVIRSPRKPSVLKELNQSWPWTTSSSGVSTARGPTRTSHWQLASTFSS